MRGEGGFPSPKEMYAIRGRKEKTHRGHMYSRFVSIFFIIPLKNNTTGGFPLLLNPPHHQRVPLRATERGSKRRARRGLSEALSAPLSARISCSCRQFFLRRPPERGGSQLERGAGGWRTVSIVCGETRGGLERLGAGAERRKSEREHT